MQFVNNKKIEKMGLPKGRTNNPGGRPAGKPNRSTEELRGVVQSFVEVNIENIQSDFDVLEPKDRLAFIERMFKHLLPPPLTLERLSEEDLERLIESLKKKHETVNYSEMTTEELMQNLKRIKEES